MHLWEFMTPVGVIVAHTVASTACLKTNICIGMRESSWLIHMWIVAYIYTVAFFVSLKVGLGFVRTNVFIQYWVATVCRID